MRVNNFDGIFWERIGDKATGFTFSMRPWYINIDHRDAEHAIVTLKEAEFIIGCGAKLRKEKRILSKLFKVLKENAKNDANDESDKQTLGDVKRKRKRNTNDGSK
jgi:hypothetical protein